MEKTLFLQLFCVAKHTTKRSGGPFLVALPINNWSGGSILIHANNEAKSMPACDLGDCRDNE